MLPAFLLPETTVQANGDGPSLLLNDNPGTLQLTLGITHTVEQESLDVSVWGSTNGEEWGTDPIAAFPQKFYCGTYSLIVDLSRHPNVKWLRAHWKVNRWGRGSLKPLFSLYVFAQLDASVRAAVTA